MDPTPNAERAPETDRDAPDPALTDPALTDPALSPDEMLDALPETPGADFAPPSEAAGRAELAEADDHLQDSVLAQELFDRAVAETKDGDEEEAVVYFMRASKLAEAAREWYLTAVACHRLGEIYRTPQPPYDLERAFRMYRRAISAYELCGHFAEARALSYRLMRVRMRRGGELGLSWRTRAGLTFYWAFAGFGYRPARVVASAAFLVLVYALAYWSVGGVVASSGEGTPGFLDAVYFSGITFATVGYGDFVPAPHARAIALTEGAVGAFTLSFFVVVLANRLRH